MRVPEKNDRASVILEEAGRLSDSIDGLELFNHLNSFGWSLTSLALEGWYRPESLFLRYLNLAARECLYESRDISIEWKTIKVWEQSHIAKAHRSLFVKKATEFVLRRINKMKYKEMAIVDLGCGSAQLFSELGFSFRAMLCSIGCKGVLVDIRESACIEAAKRLEMDVASFCKVSVLNVDMRDYQKGWLAGSSAAYKLVIAAQSMHELPFEDKKHLIRSIKESGADLFIAEIEGNHEKFGVGTEQLTYSVAEFYGQLLIALSQGRDGLDEDGDAVSKFLMREAISLLTENYDDRGNYHMPKDDWELLLASEGFEVELAHYGSVQGVCPALWVGAALNI